MKILINFNKKSYSIGLLVFFTCSISFAQAKTDTLYLTLNKAIEIAQLKSPQTLQSNTTKETSYWRWKSFKADYLPQLSLDGILPNYTKNSVAITQPDGSELYQQINTNNSFLNLSLTQAVALTGATVSVNSRLTRFDNLATDFKNYNADAVFLNINQPLFGFNSFSWDKKIEPLKYEESQKTYAEEKEFISYRTTQLYFELLFAQINYKIALGNLKNNELLQKIAETRYELGKITRNDLLKRKLAVVQDKKQISSSSLRKKTATREFLVFMGKSFLEKDQPLSLQAPTNIPEVYIDEETALNEAFKNRSDITYYKRKIIEADRNLARARANNGFKANLNVSLGFVNSNNSIENIYDRSNDRQNISIGFVMPIVDWGSSKSKLKTAQLEKDLEKQSVDLSLDDFKREVITVVEQFEMHKEQTIISLEESDIANMSYEISKNKFILGKESNTDLNLSFNEKDSAIKNYIVSLRDFWMAFYKIRQLTIYDFEKNTTLLNLN